MLDLDATIRISDLLQIGVIAGGGIYALGQMRAGMTAMREQMRVGAEAAKDEIAAVHRRLDRTDDELEKQTTILAQLAKGEARMDGLDRRLTLIEDRSATAQVPRG